jgi:hypothetical protein
MQVGKLYKSKTSTLVVECTKVRKNDVFSGIVVIGDQSNKIYESSTCWITNSFEEYIEPENSQLLTITAILLSGILANDNLQLRLTEDYKEVDGDPLIFAAKEQALKLIKEIEN